MIQTALPTVRRIPQRLDADASRVITRLFVPGQEGFDNQDSRAAAVLTRLMALDDHEVQESFDGVVARFADRHRHLLDTFRRHARELADRLGPECSLSDTRRLLLGAVFTCEYAIEGAALCNPSLVAHPDQTGVPEGSLRFVMSVRAVGEGHRSSIGFRIGTIDAGGHPAVDPPPPLATTGTTGSAPFEAAVFRRELDRLGSGGENADYVLDTLGDRFTRAELEERLGRLEGHLRTRKHGRRTISDIRRIAERTYSVIFPDTTTLPERVLWPAMGAESNGMEDARFVRFTADDGAVSYLATYTAYDGSEICQQLLETNDFATFTSSPVVGPAAANKGLALFPRRIQGRFAALSRSDRETNAVAFSDSLCEWPDSSVFQLPERAWEVLQLGNCGSPIETDDGWLVLTHGVGPMRTYSIGALLLDIDDPTKILGQLRETLLSPEPDERSGYVPNVVYCCGALVHGGTLVIPSGIGDSAVAMATVPVAELLGALGG
ncbi:MAG: glycoside hydrolase family 130 protein [Acidimicrobiales bacterium]